MERKHHELLVDAENPAGGHCRCGRHTEGLSSQGTLSEKVSDIQYANRRFLASLGHDGESNLAVLNVEDRVSCLALSEDRLCLAKGEYFPPFADGRKEFPWVESALLGRYDVSRAERHFVPRDLSHYVASLGKNIIHLRAVPYTHDWLKGPRTILNAAFLKGGNPH